MARPRKQTYTMDMYLKKIKEGDIDNNADVQRRFVWSKEQINELIDAVETEIFNMGEKEVSSQVIGELVMNKVKDLDAVAYVRFASVYREFKDINTFMDELKKVLDK